MDLRQLRYFVAVAEAGHMTRAAARLGIQQPPLSHQIKALEQHLGLHLLHRHPKGVSLTDSGQLMLVEARQLLASFTGMQERLRLAADGRLGQLALGFTSSAAAHAFTPAVLRACRKQHPGIALTLLEHHAAHLIEAVAKAQLHCAFLRVPVAQPEGVTFETLFSEPTLLAVPLEHRLAAVPHAATTPVALRELQDEPLILVRQPGAPGLYGNLLKLCAREGFEPCIAMEVERMMTNLNFVAAGAGLSLVPASMRGVHAHSIVYRPFQCADELQAPLTVAYRARDAGGPTATLLGLARQIASDHAGHAGSPP